MTINKICANLQTMLDDKACHDEMTAGQVVAVEEAMQALHRTAEYDKAQSERRLVVLPCEVGDDIFTKSWSIKNQKYEVFAGKVKNVRYDAIDGSVMVSDGEYYNEWGKDAFPSRQEAEAALGGDGDG